MRVALGFVLEKKKFLAQSRLWPMSCHLFGWLLAFEKQKQVGWLYIVSIHHKVMRRAWERKSQYFHLFLVHRRISLIIITSFQELINLIWRHAGMVAFSLCRKTRSIATFPKTTATLTSYACWEMGMVAECRWKTTERRIIRFIHASASLFKMKKKIVTIIPLHAKRSP